MDKWQTAEWLGFIAIIVAVLFGVAALIANRKFGNRRGRLLVAHTTSRLLASGSLSNYLKVTYRDFDVEDPHLVSLLLKNVGPHDITREQFEGGKFRIELLDSKLYGLVQNESSDGEKPSLIISGGIGAEDAVVGFQPTLFPKGTEWTVEAIVSGPAKPTVRGRLVNTDIIEGETTSQAVLGALANISSLTVSTLLGEITLGVDRNKR